MVYRGSCPGPSTTTEPEFTGVLGRRFLSTRTCGPNQIMARPVKRSFTIGGHRTSISLEAPFWDALRDIARKERIPLARLVQRIDEQRGESGLSSAVRVWILYYFWKRK